MRKAVSSGGIIFNGNNILFVRYPQTFLTFPKGTVEPGETVEDTALREVHEETGLDELSITRKLGIVTRNATVRSGEKVIKDIHLFLMTTPNFTQTDPEEITEWHTIAEALPYMHPEESDFLKQNF